MNDQDLLAAAEDYIAQQLGAHVPNAHPLAHDITLRDLAVICGRKARPFDRNGDERILAAAGMGTSEFSKALATGAQAPVTARFAAQAGHLRFCWPFELRDFTPATVPAVDAEVHLLPVGQHEEIQRGYVRTAAGSTQVRLVRYARIIEFSRHLIIASEWDLIGMQLATVGPNAARLQASLVVAALEENPTLDDGAPVFHADHNNMMESFSLGSATPDVAGLDVAMQALRTQQLASGGAAGLELRHLAVAPDLEIQAIAALHACGLTERISITVMTALPAGRWYAFADPNLAPTIAVLSLRGDKQKVPVRVEQAKRPPTHDGAAVKVSAELGAAMVGRIGVFRAQVSA